MSLRATLETETLQLAVCAAREGLLLAAAAAAAAG